MTTASADCSRPKEARAGVASFPAPAARELSDLEIAALTIRHRAAVEALKTTPAFDRWRLLVEIVAPSEAVKLASERRAVEMARPNPLRSCSVAEGSEPDTERVPNAESATADPRKFTEYLLSETHTQGQTKARVFRRYGYNQSNWTELRDAFLAQLPQTSARLSKRNPRGGENYEAPMQIKAPGGTVDIQTIWEVHPTSGTTFVTAYPL